jgi:hypothetical protein
MKVLGVNHPEPTHDRGRDIDSASNGRRLGRRDRYDIGSEPLRGEYEWRPVLSEADIRALAPGQVLVLRRNLAAVVGWAPKSKQRKRNRVPLPRTDAEAIAQLEAMYNAPSARVHRLRARIRTAAQTTAGRAVGRVVTRVRLVVAGWTGTPDDGPRPSAPVRVPHTDIQPGTGSDRDGRDGGRQ